MVYAVCHIFYLNVSVYKPSSARNVANIDRPPFIVELSSVSEFSAVEKKKQYCDYLRTEVD